MNRICFATVLLLMGLVLPVAAQPTESFQTVLLSDRALPFNLMEAYDNPPLPGRLGVRFKPLTTKAEAQALIRQLGYILLDTLSVRMPTANPPAMRNRAVSEPSTDPWQKLGYVFKIFVDDDEWQARQRLLQSPLVREVTLVFPSPLRAPWR